MIDLRRGMVIDVRLDPAQGSETGKMRPCIVVTNDSYNAKVPVVQVVPVTEWSSRKAEILTNVDITPTNRNGLTKRSIADCLQTRPVDRRHRLARVRGDLEADLMLLISEALRRVFALD